MKKRANANERRATERVKQGRICVLRSLLFLIVLTSNLYSQSATEIEYRFKAVYLFNFLQLIEWPKTAFATDEAPLIVGILGKDPFGDVLDDLLNNERINERRIVIRRYKDYEDIARCQVLFVSASESDRIQEILSRVEHQSVLTVGEKMGFAGQGGGVNFYIENNRVRFEINPDALRKADLHASSKLLRLARLVTTSKDG